MPENEPQQPISREQFVENMRRYVGTPFGHQGRGAVLDCGGYVLVGAREHGFTDLEILGYARFPTDGRFEELLQAHTDFVGEYRWPFAFTGTELLPGDLISFDYGNDEGTRHVSWISKWDGRRYHILEAQPNYGACEHAIAHPFVKRKTRLMGWSLTRYFGN